MNILMLTNTYTPHVGGVARSVETFAAEYRNRGHKVLVIAPEFENQPANEIDVVRIPAIQNFNGSDFSVALPIPGLLKDILETFQPDIVHSHHPYLLGMTALRIARYRQLPLVFTHHTMYEQYTHYVPLDSPVFSRFVIELATRYANLCDQVFAPSESIAELLHQRGVKSPITVIPTGVDIARFRHGDGAQFRSTHTISEKAFLVGHLGRLAPEKNLKFLTTAVAQFLKKNPHAEFLVVGSGPSELLIREIFDQAGLTKRLHIVGILRSVDLINAYHAMNVFAFASRSETQGMVLTEAMAAGLPVVGLDAPGVREVIKDKQNGRLLAEPSIEKFSDCLQWIESQTTTSLQKLQVNALQTADDFSMSHSASKALTCYENLRMQTLLTQPQQYESLKQLHNLLKVEWDIVKGMASATSAAFEDN
jgi:1,2-diacylglycerol 3-alpha-glucosyltransferase